MCGLSGSCGFSCGDGCVGDIVSLRLVLFGVVGKLWSGWLCVLVWGCSVSLWVLVCVVVMSTGWCVAYGCMLCESRLSGVL